MKNRILLIVTCLCLAAPVAPVAPAWADAQDDFAQGLSAYQAGKYAKAARWTRTAAEQNHATAQHNLGVMYRDGKGVRRNDKEAVYWTRKSAEQGFAAAQNNLGVMYYRGKGVVQNYEAAADWTRKAAEQGDITAQYNLGLMYERGEGVVQNYKEAHKWALIAQANGDAEAKTLVQELEAKLSLADISVAQGDATTLHAEIAKRQGN